MIDHTPLEVTQVAHDDTHTVDVTISPVEWRQIVGDIARRIYHVAAVERQRVLPLVYGAGRPDNDLDRARALTALIDVLGMPAPSFTMRPELAEAVGIDLMEAAAEPPTCRCGRFVDRPSELTDTCAVCTTRSERLRVVS